MHILKCKLDSFCASHRVTFGNSGKCRKLHGHNFNINVTVGAEKLDASGYVIDLTIIKNLFEPWVIENWDHAVIISGDDGELLDFLKKTEQKYYLLPSDCNTTVEVLSKYLFNIFDNILQKEMKGACNGINLLQVEMSETDTISAIYTKETTFVNNI